VAKLTLPRFLPLTTDQDADLERENIGKETTLLLLTFTEPEALFVFAVATAKESKPFSRERMRIENSEKTGNPKKCRVRRECN
jgi:hypothetical protein